MVTKIAVAKQICQLQGINLNLEVVIRCPFCEQKQARINLNRAEWSCKCGKKGDLEELLTLVEEDWMDNHKLGKYQTRNAKGVCY